MSKQTKNVQLNFQTTEEAQQLFGANDRFLKLLSDHAGIELSARGTELRVSGDEVKVIAVQKTLQEILKRIQHGQDIQERDYLYFYDFITSKKEEQVDELYNYNIAKSARGKKLFAKSQTQQQYVEAINQEDLVFGVGPAGTGKTFLAVVCAVQALRNNQVKRIVLTRPALEAGENLGFLPGDMKEKVDPYLRPLYDGLYEMLGAEQTARLLERGVIEVAPLAFMRGRTLNESFVILDEAQNTTDEQMKMFLTRLGSSSKMVVTGDITQIDLPHNRTSGLKTALHLLRNVKGINITEFTNADVVRHPLVQRILEQYEKAEAKK
ncbi:PhoH family protein [Culicoidibacter larvae]|uniref:PhoH-like protein n=1 Tax=Culicoidibacter larvae TaxID=2579976 RepID=A0A5R8Q8R8_9FIRM|nr:PhoH family protein [Culicoidibacter larvae]TLG72101.1 phosphate starvation-inducible protein PhoH [Culicoidibacter larvae]